MMLGTLSQRPRIAPYRPEWVPEDATAFLDFVNGHYYAGGQSRNVASILGGGFDAGQIFDGGMLIAYENSNRPKAIGALFSDLAAGLAAGCTVVVEANHQNVPDGPYLMWLDAASQDLASNDVDFGAGSMTAYVEDFSDVFFTGGDLSSTGTHIVTATLNRDNGDGSREYAVSVDGGAFVTQTVSYDPFSPVDTILIGHDGDESYVLDNTLVRSIILYPPQATPLLAAGTPVPDAMVGLAYSAQMSATGGTVPYTFSIASGTLPSGLSINSSTGEISGTPSGTGVSSGIVLRVTDADGSTDDLPSFTITVRNTLVRLVDQKNNMGAATFTLTGVNFGPATGRSAIAIVATGAGVSHSVDAMTIGGDAASGQKTINDRSAAIYFADPSGTSGDVDVTVSAINIFVEFTVFALYGVDASIFDSDSLVDSSGSNDSFNVSLDTDANGIVLAALCANVKTVDVTWTGLTEMTDFDPAGAANERSSTAALMDSTSTTLSVTADTSGTTGAALAVVSFPGL
ncbi:MULTISPECIES: Ig domain-containing protein [unclassified Mesorhizobium]|uniref:Ig domain-containing protein n=1 Tax=unclassified Mesorhizobium TaxID=325217 RepID=UPI0024161F01|nr:MULTISPECIES: Ig domain-containing protein [unclassified Mesorhizobium]MDG4902782.1 Ig domain-containing protein [Mesorhizobium sp. WSM4962]MDG4920791.1 Ig domain-containing protein [Mesorhizobium sp. WSM4989]